MSASPGAAPPLPSVIAVTGTGTGVGKTVVTAALAATLAAAGVPVAVVKPAQTGVAPDEPGDAAEVARLAGTGAVHELVRLADPLAPESAARLRGLPLPTVAEHADAVARLVPTGGTVLVEGAGGVLVRLDRDGGTLADLAGRLLPAPGAAALVVAAAGLGTLNATELTVAALRERGVPVVGVVIGSWPQRPGLAERCNLDDLPRLTGVPLVGVVPDGAGALPVAAFRTRAPGWLSPLVCGTRAAPPAAAGPGTTATAAPPASGPRG